MNRRELIKSLAAVPVMAGGAASPRATWSQGEGSGAVAGEQRCYTDEWKRTQPDHVLYLPPEPLGDDGDNEHLIVVETPRGTCWRPGARGPTRCLATTAPWPRGAGTAG